MRKARVSNLKEMLEEYAGFESSRLKNIDCMITTFMDSIKNQALSVDMMDILRKIFGNIRPRNIFGEFNVPSYIQSNALLAAAYTETYALKWDILFETGNAAAIRYGNVEFIVPRQVLFDIEEEKDYSQVNIEDMRENMETMPSLLPVGMEKTPMAYVLEEEKGQQAKLELISQQQKRIMDCETEELAALKEEIRRKELALREKQETLMAELKAKQAEMESAMDILKKRIFMLQAEIYSIRCFHGETVELLKLRSGKDAANESPLVINQKLLYLDEDLARLLSIYNEDILINYRILEEALKYNDDAMDAFCPQEKCITFFRVSKNGEKYSQDGNLVDACYMLHGNKIGFLVRNGEILYCGWLEDEWKDETELTFEDELFLRKGSLSAAAAGNETSKSTPVNERVSRMFAMSVLPFPRKSQRTEAIKIYCI